jgi:multidrug resistance efflux pump
MPSRGFERGCAATAKALARQLAAEKAKARRLRAQLDQAQANVAAAGAAIGNIEQQKRLQETLIKQADAEIQASEADVTRYHMETVRQQTLLSD